MTAPAVLAEGTEAPPPRRKRTPRKVLNTFLWYASAVVLALFIIVPDLPHLHQRHHDPRGDLLLPQVDHPQRASRSTTSQFFINAGGVIDAFWRSVVVGVITVVLALGHRRTGRLRHRALRLPRA